MLNGINYGNSQVATNMWFYGYACENLKALRKIILNESWLKYIRLPHSSNSISRSIIW